MRKKQYKNSNLEGSMLFSLHQVRDQIFHLKLNTRYNTNMCFWRYSEYGESSYWQERVPTLVEFMSWYSQEHSTARYEDGIAEVFSYTTDWAGFNIPSTTFDILLPEKEPSPIKDWNQYDSIMLAAVTHIRSIVHGKSFYLIGTAMEDRDSEDTLLHEMSHALYFLCADYKEKQQKILLNINAKWRVSLKKVLKKMMYADSVIEDEMIAYISTGASDEMDRLAETEEWRENSKKMRRVLLSAVKKISS